MKISDLWNSQHEKYSQTDWIDKPSLFAVWAKDYFPKTGKILELGCGQGQDTRFFAESGYSITALDFAEKGIEYAKEKTGQKSNIEFKVSDFSKALDYPDQTFDIVYSHLALHYFDKETTNKLFSEIHRVLKVGGIFAFLVNSTNDPEYGTGTKIEENYLEVRGMNKRFFDIEAVKSFAKDFEIIVLDDNGETYKDRAIATENLIRFVGRK